MAGGDENRRATWLSRATIGALAVSLALAVFTPLYTDEIGWRFQLSRAPFDGGVDRYIAPGCASPMIAAPWFLHPLRSLSAWGNALVPDPAAVRLLGVAMAVAIVAALMLVVRRASEGRERAALMTVMAGALGLGLLPFLLVWSRPEQPILSCIVLSIALALWRPAPGARALWMACGVVLLLGIVALGYHLKAIFYLPVFVAAIWLAVPGMRSRAVRGGATLALLAAAAAVYPYWATRFLCPGDSLVDSIHRAENLGATPAGQWSWGLIGAALSGAGPGGYIGQTLPGWVHMSDWVAPTSLPNLVVAVWRAGVSAGWWLMLIAGMAALVVGGVRGWRVRRADPRWIMAASLAVSLLGWSIAQLNDNAYESMLWLPLGGLASVLAMASLEPAPWRYVQMLAMIVGGLALSSHLLLWSDNARLIPASRPAGFVAGRPYSINPFGYNRAAIRATGRLCGIADDAPGVVIDDWTYFAYQRSYRPIYAIGIFGRWRGRMGDPVAYLRQQGSPGVVAACRSIPEPLRTQARRNGSLCCVAIPPKSALARGGGSVRR